MAIAKKQITWSFSGLVELFLSLTLIKNII